MGKSIIMVVAPQDFRDEEYFKPKEVFQKYKLQVYTATEGVKIARGKFGSTISVDMDISKIKAKDFDAIVFVGGPGAKTYIGSYGIGELIKEFVTAGKLVCAICMAPMILAKAGVLEGRRATVWDEDKVQSKEFKQIGVKYSNDEVTIDGQFITAKGPEVAEKFGEVISEILMR